MSERAKGVVQEWRDNGYGFIMFGDGRRAYVHNSAFGGQHLRKGQSVTAVVTEDQRNPGKYMATQVELDEEDGLLQGMPTPVLAAAASGERIEGRVQEWNERGFGFVEYDGSNTRAYVHSSQCPDGQHLQPGEQVSFVLVQDSVNPGKFAAHNVQRGPIGEDGVVSQWNEAGGYGFLNMDDGRRVYVHRSMLGMGGEGSLNVGQRLRVTVQPDTRNPGKWMVLEVKGEIQGEAPQQYQQHASSNVMSSPLGQLLGAIGKASPATSSALNNTFEQGGFATDASAVNNTFGGAAVNNTFAGGGDPMNNTFGGGGAETNDLTTVVGGEADGTVSEWREDGGFGFLMMDDGRRVYIHRSFFGGAPGTNLVLGQRLRVTTKADSRNPGKWCVSEVIGEIVGEDNTYTAQPQPEAAQAVQFAQPTQLGQPMQAAQTDLMSSSLGQMLGAVAAAASASSVPPPQTNADTSLSSMLGTPIGARPGVGAAAAIGSASADLSEAADGTVSEWREEGGFGFISMDDGRRVYIHRSMFGGIPGHGSLIIGQRLRVTTKPDARHPGKWCVSEVIGEIIGEQGAVGSFSAPAPQQVLPQPSLAAAVNTNASMSASGEQISEPHDGTVTDWNESGGYGFLKMDNGQRVYIHRSFFGGVPGAGSLTVGQRLRVTTKPDNRNPGRFCVNEVIGEIHGENVGILDPKQQATADALAQKTLLEGLDIGEGQEGTVTEFREDGGYGFLSMDDGRRVYIHRHNFGGAGSLAKGMRMRVTTKPDTRNPGKWCVNEVISGGPEVQQQPIPQQMPQLAAQVPQLAGQVPQLAGQVPQLAGAGFAGLQAGALGSVDLASLAAAQAHAATNNAALLQMLGLLPVDPAAKRQRTM